MTVSQDLLSIESKVAALADSVFFRGLDGALLNDVAGEASWLRLRAGETLMQQGDPGDSLFVVVGGRLRAFYVRANGAEGVLGDIERGETVGEMAILTQEPRSATVRAVRDSFMARLSKDNFDRLAQKYPQLMVQMARLLVRRLNVVRAGGAPAARTTNLVLVPAGTDAPVAEVARRLVTALLPYGAVLHLNAQAFDGIWGTGAAECSRDDARILEFIRWFSQQEHAHRFVVLECNAEAGNWSSRCIGQADRLFLVGKAGADPGLSAVEAHLLNKEHASRARRELVLVYGGDRPSGTQAWLDRRQVTRHHHVRLEAAADFARLGRCLNGRAIGLVLGGGGARGFAHIGVVRAFAELGVPIDFVGGTSMGSVVAGQLAMGMSWEDMLAAARKGFIDTNPLKDYTFPMIGIITGRRMNQVLQAMYGDARIEDLRVNFFCVSNSLTRAEMTVHTSGPLWRWVRASTAVPGVIAPVLENGELMIDGGVLNNLPVDVMQAHGEGHVIAVDVSPRIEMRTDLPNGDHLSGWNLLWKRLNPFGAHPTLPTLAKVMSRTTMLASVHNSEAMQRRADLYLHPPVDAIDMFAWNALDDLAEIGYQDGLKQLAAWKQAAKAT